MLDVIKAAVLLTAFNAKWTMRHDGFLWSIPKAVRLYCHRGVWQIISLLSQKARHLLTLIHTLYPVLWNERWRDCAAARHACSLSLGFKGARLTAVQPVPFTFSWRLICPRCLSCLRHSYTAAKELLTSTGGKVCACALISEGCARVCVWGREIETGMTRGCLKSERKHSPALSSH